MTREKPFLANPSVPFVGVMESISVMRLMMTFAAKNANNFFYPRFQIIKNQPFLSALSDCLHLMSASMSGMMDLPQNL